MENINRGPTFGDFVTDTPLPPLLNRLRIRIPIGSEFNGVSGSGSGFGIRIRIQEGKKLSPKAEKIKKIMF
jgi:hypothetical protein